MVKRTEWASGQNGQMDGMGKRIGRQSRQDDRWTE